MLLFSHQVMSDFLQTHGLQHARLPCPSPFPRARPSSHPVNQWCHSTISSGVISYPKIQWLKTILLPKNPYVLWVVLLTWDRLCWFYCLFILMCSAGVLSDIWLVRIASLTFLAGWLVGLDNRGDQATWLSTPSRLA